MPQPSKSNRNGVLRNSEAVSGKRSRPSGKRTRSRPPRVGLMVATAPIVKNAIALTAGLLVAPALPAAGSPITSKNLLINGDAEAHRCTDDWTAQSSVPGWRVVRGAASVLCYSAFNHAGDVPVLPSNAASGRGRARPLRRGRSLRLRADARNGVSGAAVREGRRWYREGGRSFGSLHGDTVATLVLVVGGDRDHAGPHLDEPL